jgi:large subunit ribosomal protein L31e
MSLRQVYGATFKKRTPKAVKAIKEFAKLHMVPSSHPRVLMMQGTTDVRIDPQLNKKV